MPIRMTDDPVDPNQQNDDGGGGMQPAPLPPPTANEGWRNAM